MLRVEIDDLRGTGFDLGLIGFSADEIAALTFDKNAGLTDPDEAPEAPAIPVSAPGDVWLLGKHRLVCGDCTDSLVVDKALAGVKPHLMVTDPPYGVEYDAAWRGHVRTANGKRLSLGVHAKGKVENDGKADWREAWVLFPGDVAYVWHAAMRVGESKESLEEAGFALRAQIIWAKNNFAISRGHYHFQHEPCWYAVREGSTGHWCGGHKQTSVWHIDKPQKSETGHSTQKPVECMKRPIENNSSPGQAVYEPFVGTGTTIIAAEMTGRACHAVELHPAYVDVAVTRWQNFTGQIAMLEASGETFVELMARHCLSEPINAASADKARDALPEGKRGGRRVECQIEPGWPVLQSGEQQHLYRVEADGTQTQRVCDSLFDLMLAKVLHQSQHLNELAATGVAHARFH